MAIQTYADLKAAVGDYINRYDPDTLNRVPDFIQSVHVRLQETVDALLPLVNDADTNALLTYDPSIYLWGALAEAAAFLRDDELLATYGGKFQARVQRLRATGYSRLRVNLRHRTP